MPNLVQHFILLLLLLCVHMCVLTWVCEGQRTILKIPFSSATWFFRRRLRCYFCHAVYSKSSCLPLPSWWRGAGIIAHYTGITWIWLFFFFMWAPGMELGSRGLCCKHFYLWSLLTSCFIFYYFNLRQDLMFQELRLASNSCQIKTITLRDGGGPHF